MMMTILKQSSGLAWAWQMIAWQQTFYSKIQSDMCYTASANVLLLSECFLRWGTWRLLCYIFRDIGVYHKNGVCLWRALIILYHGPIHFLVSAYSC